MPMKYKIDVLSVLKDSGYNTNRIRKEKLLGEYTLQKLRSGEPVAWKSLETLCELLRCQPGDLLEYVEE
ncbi:MAG: helix-turn-helix transcriptional regulator [Eubacteriales bacterium]|nr:helix-turn-helix transcriptional regulator [Eubacteriales bacterium]